MDVGKARKKRLHPHGSSSLSKRQYTRHEAQVDSSIHSNEDTVTFSRLHAEVPDQLSCHKEAYAALNSDFCISSFSASASSSRSAGMTSVDTYGIREYQNLFPERKGKDTCWSIPPLKSSTLDADVEVSELTFEKCDNVDSPAGTFSDSVPHGASGFSNIMSRDEVWHRVRNEQKLPSFSHRQSQMRDMHWGARYSRVKDFSDESGSSCEEPIADMLFEDKRLQYTNVDACMPDGSLTSGVEKEKQSAGFSDARGNFSTFFDETRVEMPNCNDLGEDTLEIKSADTSRIEMLKKGGSETLWMGKTCDKGNDCIEVHSQAHPNDQENDDEPCPSYVLSSGRLSLEEEAQLGRRRPTIDLAFEEYFSTLML